MIARYVIYINNDSYRGYYTGSDMISTQNQKFPGIVATIYAVDVGLYKSLDSSKQAIYNLADICTDVCEFSIIEYFSKSTVYIAKYNNGILEREQEF